MISPIVIKLNVDSINQAHNVPIKITVSSGYWLIYSGVAEPGYRLICELYPRDTPPQDEEWAPYRERKHHPSRRILYPVGVCELRIADRHIRRYTPDILAAMRACGATDAWGHIPAQYRGVEINSGDNVVHTTLYALTRGGDIEVLDVDHSVHGYGKYSIPISEDEVACLVAVEENSLLGTSKKVFVAGGAANINKYLKYIKSV